jgi:hypothetical protein
MDGDVLWAFNCCLFIDIVRFFLFLLHGFLPSSHPCSILMHTTLLWLSTKWRISKDWKRFIDLRRSTTSWPIWKLRKHCLPYDSLQWVIYHFLTIRKFRMKSKSITELQLITTKSATYSPKKPLKNN